MINVPIRRPMHVTFASLEYLDPQNHRLELQSASELVRVSFETAQPVRSFVSYRSKKNYEGLYACVNLDLQVRFESLLESLFLLQLDWENTATAIAAQPFWVHWQSDQPISHAPDYFVRLRNGDGLVVDVRPAERIDDKAHLVFEQTRRLCEQVGWRYCVFGTPQVDFINSLKVFREYSSFQLGDDDKIATLLGFAQVPTSIDELVSTAQKIDLSAGEARGVIFRLLWERRLTADLSTAMSSATKVWTC